MTDGNLPYALRQLDNALNRLFQPQTLHTPSLYQQLAQAIPGSANGTGNNRNPQSTPPLNLDAAQLKDEIDTALTIWKLHKRRWRPQDVKSINHATRHIKTWANQIQALLDPAPRRTLPDACPQCGETHAYHYNSAGEYVRGGALQISPDGCECGSCHTQWPPEHLELLGAVLGYPNTTQGDGGAT